MKLKNPNAVLTALAALLLAGCASMDGTAEVGHYTVRVKTPMFRYGPAQSFGPDFSLEPGQHVVMVRKESGYSRIMTDDGQTGYVATEDVVPAPPPAKPAAMSRNNYAMHLPPRGTARPGISSANNRIMEAGPLFDGGDLPPLPESDSPGTEGHGHSATPTKKDAHKPEFRFPKPKPGFRVNIPTPEPKP